MSARSPALLGVLLGCTNAAAFAADSTSIQTLQLTTTAATLRGDLPVQKSATFALRATLTPADAALAAGPPLQEGASFSLTAALTTSTAVCYYDTIFRDDFDGDGF